MVHQRSRTGGAGESQAHGDARRAHGSRLWLYAVLLLALAVVAVATMRGPAAAESLELHVATPEPAAAATSLRAIEQGSSPATAPAESSAGSTAVGDLKQARGEVKRLEAEVERLGALLDAVEAEAARERASAQEARSAMRRGEPLEAPPAAAGTPDAAVAASAAAATAGAAVGVAPAAPAPSTEAPPNAVSEAEALDALRALGSALSTTCTSRPAADGKKTWRCADPGTCKRRQAFGSGWGKHELCHTPSLDAPDCTVLSYGIHQDYSFDSAAGKAGCRVFSLDPTVAHKSVLGPEQVRFLNFGAPGVVENDAWVVVSPMALRRMLASSRGDGEAPPRLAALKMDCEGCEYVLYRDTMAQDPHFWDDVDQLAIEVHVPAYAGFMQSREQMLGWGKLLVLLERSGLRLADADITSCAPHHEKAGCLPELVDLGWEPLCGSYSMCHNYLFSRPT